MLMQRLRTLTRPTKYWGPALVEHRKLVDYVEDFVVDPWSDSDNISTSSDSQTLAQAIDDSVSIGPALSDLPSPNQWPRCDQTRAVRALFFPITYVRVHYAYLNCRTLTSFRGRRC